MDGPNKKTRGTWQGDAGEIESSIVTPDGDKAKENLPEGWERVALRGGPFDGDTALIPIAQDSIVYYHGPHAHRYHRLRDWPILHHEAAIPSVGGRRR